MAAFENVSRVNLRPVDRESEIDIRTTTLDSVLSVTNDFDPRMHRKPKAPIKVWMAYFNLVRTGLGAGVLGFPLAISQAGYLLGSVLAICTALLLVHTHLTLLKCINIVSKHLRIPFISYRYCFRIALLHGPPIFHWIGDHGSLIIATFMLLSQVGICTVYVTFTSDSLRDLMDWQSATSALMTLLVPYLLLTHFMKHLKAISYVSLMGNFLSFLGFGLMFYHIYKDKQETEFVYGIWEPLHLLFAFGTFLFNMSAVGVILSLEKALVKPILMVTRCGVIKVGILLPAFIVTVFGVLGYWSFGEMEENVLRVLPFDDISAMIVIGLYLVAIAFAYPLQCYPAISIVLDIMRHMEKVPSPYIMDLVETIIRPSFVLLTFFISYMVPFQGPFVAFVGNLCTTMLALVFPAMMDISLMYPGPYGKFKVHLIKNILIIILGCVSFVFGIFYCGYLIYVRIKSSYSNSEDEFFR